MAINRFDSVPEANYKPTTLRIPFEELMQQGLIKQKAYDDNEDYEYKLQGIMQQLQADPKAQFAKQIVDEKYNQRMVDLSTRIADKGDIDYERELRKIASEYNNDPLVQTIKQRKTNYDLYQQDVIKNKDKYVDFYDPYNTEGDIQSMYKQTGQLNPFNYSGMDQRQDYAKRGQDLVANIAKEGSLRNLYDKNPDGSINYNSLGQAIKRKVGAEGVVRSTVNRVANVNAEPFLKTQEGRFFIHELFGRGGFEYDDLPAKEKQLVKTQAANYLAKLAEKQIGLTNVREESVDNLSEAQMKLSETGDLSVVDLGDVPLENITSYDQFKVSLPGTPAEQTNAQILEGMRAGLTKGGSQAFGPKITSGKEAPKTKDFKLSADQNKLYEKASRILGANGANDQEKGKIINNYLDKLKKQSLSSTVTEIKDKDERKNENEFLFGSKESGGMGITERSVKLIDGEGPKDGRGTDILKEYGNTKKYNINVSAKLNPGNPWFEAGRVVKVTDNEGNVVARYAVSGSYSEKANNKVAHEFYQTKYDPFGEKTINIQGTELKLEFENITDPNTLNDDGTPIKIGERAVLKDKSGKVVRDIKTQGDAIGELYESLRK